MTQHGRVYPRGTLTGTLSHVASNCRFGVKLMMSQFCEANPRGYPCTTVCILSSSSIRPCFVLVGATWGQRADKGDTLTAGPEGAFTQAALPVGHVGPGAGVLVHRAWERARVAPRFCTCELYSRRNVVVCGGEAIHGGCGLACEWHGCRCVEWGAV